MDYDFSHGGFSHGGLRPALAKKWFSSKNQKYWTFILKKNVQWSDGVQLKAQHFLDSWREAFNPQNRFGICLFFVCDQKREII